MTDKQQQTSIWQQRSSQQWFAELCNALYERELSRLANQSEHDIQQLQKHLASLSYYIKRAADHICELTIPLELDTQNGSWLSGQSTKPFSAKAEQDKTKAFFQKHQKMALIVPIAVVHSGIEQVVLDTIDELDETRQWLHCNQHGWFSIEGTYQGGNRVIVKTLLKPSKAVMSAACCGHQWLNGRRTSARLLSLREMLLASRINWRQLSQLLPIKK